MRRISGALFAATVLAQVLTVPVAEAATIGTADIVAIPSGVVGSGNGTLDLRMGTHSGSEIDNAVPGSNFDNGNNALAQGGGGNSSSFVESYVTTAGELQDYYTLNFGATTTGEIQLVIFLDLNETGGGEEVNSLDVLDVVLNPTSIAPDPTGDVTSAEQAAINQGLPSGPGGTVIAGLNPEPADNLPVNAQGAGFADYAISTGIDPFALAASDVVLFNFSMSSLNNGAEEIFLSGEFAASDIPGLPQIPEPGTGLLLGTGLLGLTWRRRASISSTS